MDDRVWIGLDTAAALTALCAINAKGEVLERYFVRTSPTDVHSAIDEVFGNRIAEIGLEACGTSVALARGLRKLGHKATLFDCAQVKRFASIRRAKTDENDARSLADVARLGHQVLTAVHLKSSECLTMRSKLAVRHNIIKQRKATEAIIRGFLSLYGQTVGVKIKAPHRLRHHVEARIDAIRNETGEEIGDHVSPLIDMAERQRQEVARLDREIAAFAEGEDVCARFMAVPGVGALTAVSFFTAIEDPARFSRSTDIGAYFGLTPKIYQSGSVNRQGRITKAGNTLTRFHLIAAAHALLGATKTDCELRRWGLDRALAVGRPKARIAVARKLSTILFALWRDNTSFAPFPKGTPRVIGQTHRPPTVEDGVGTPFNHVGHGDPEASVVELGVTDLLLSALTEKQRERIKREQRERVEAAELWSQGTSVRDIAARLKLTVSTVHRRLPEGWSTVGKQPVTKDIRAYVLTLSNGEPIWSKQFSHVGKRSTVHQALIRLVAEGILSRVGNGAWVRVAT